jgi:site-specific DNA recombinase
MNYVFYGLAPTTDRRAARALQTDQLADASRRMQRHGGHLVADYFDVYPDKLRAWRHRRQGRRLLQAIQDEQRGFDAVTIGNTISALTASGYDELLWLCTEHSVRLWLPEIDEPIDPTNQGHHEIVSALFWGPLTSLRQPVLLPAASTLRTTPPTHTQPGHPAT